MPAIAVERIEQQPVLTEIPEVTLLHDPEGGEAVFGIFVVAVLDGAIGREDSIVGKSV